MTEVNRRPIGIVRRVTVGRCDTVHTSWRLRGAEPAVATGRDRIGFHNRRAHGHDESVRRRDPLFV